MEAADQELPQTDGGLAAWKFLFGGFMIEAFQWGGCYSLLGIVSIVQRLIHGAGFALCFGVFQNYYSSHAPFTGNNNIPVLGTPATGVPYLGAPLMIPLINRWPQDHQQMVWVGWALSVLGLLASSFATTMGVLIATQGVL